MSNCFFIHGGQSTSNADFVLRTHFGIHKVAMFIMTSFIHCDISKVIRPATSWPLRLHITCKIPTPFYGRLLKRSRASCSRSSLLPVPEDAGVVRLGFSDGGVRLLSHSFIIADAVRLRLPGVRLLNAGQGISSRIGVTLMALLFRTSFEPLEALL